MKKMTLKEMNKRVQELNMYGYKSAEDVFRHGLHCLESAQESLHADRENPIKYQIDRIVNDLHDIGIAENILREWYGIRFCDIGTHKSLNCCGAQIYNGIDEIAQALSVELKEVDDWGLKKTFNYDWVQFTQLAERNSPCYRKAFDGNPKQYSTTYEKAYGHKCD